MPNPALHRTLRQHSWLRPGELYVRLIARPKMVAKPPFVRRCPTCGVVISEEVFLIHYEETHARTPTEGEIFRFASPKERPQKKAKGGKRISFFRGGLPSLGKN